MVYNSNMYLLRQEWSAKEKTLFVAVLATVPWSALLLGAHALGRSALSLEMGIAASGFLALAFVLLQAVLLALLSWHISVPDIAFILRKTLGLLLLLSPLAIASAPFFPLGLFLCPALSALVLSRKGPQWQQRPVDETVRLEPVFFLAVGWKVVIVLLLWSYAL